MCIISPLTICTLKSYLKTKYNMYILNSFFFYTCSSYLFSREYSLQYIKEALEQEWAGPSGCVLIAEAQLLNHATKMQIFVCSVFHRHRVFSENTKNTCIKWWKVTCFTSKCRHLAQVLVLYLSIFTLNYTSPTFVGSNVLLHYISLVTSNCAFRDFNIK